MWVAVVLICLQSDGQDRCGSNLLQRFWETEIICKQQAIAEARQAVSIIHKGGAEVTWLKMECYNTDTGSGA
jgi:hypothetical protein